VEGAEAKKGYGELLAQCASSGILEKMGWEVVALAFRITFLV
jgi:hypothetical protein